MNEKTRYAQQLFMYGEGSTPPIKSIQKLSMVSGVPERTLRDHIKKWRKDSEELAIQHKDSPFSLSLSPETLCQHRLMVETLGDACDKLRRRIEGLNVKSEAYPHVLAAYQSALTKWEKSSGIEAHYKAAEAGLRERQKVSQREKEKARLAKQGQAPVRKVNTDHFQQ